MRPKSILASSPWINMEERLLRLSVPVTYPPWVVKSPEREMMLKPFFPVFMLAFPLFFYFISQRGGAQSQEGLLRHRLFLVFSGPRRRLPFGAPALPAGSFILSRHRGDGDRISVELLDRKMDVKDRAAARLASDMDLSAVIGDDAVADGQTHSRSISLGGEEGIEDPGHVFRLDSASVILHADMNPVAQLSPPNPHLSLFSEGLQAVLDQIDQHLLQLFRIPFHHHRGGGRFRRQLMAVQDGLRFQQSEHVGDQPVQL